MYVVWLHFYLFFHEWSLLQKRIVSKNKNHCDIFKSENLTNFDKLSVFMLWNKKEGDKPF